MRILTLTLISAGALIGSSVAVLADNTAVVPTPTSTTAGPSTVATPQPVPTTAALDPNEVVCKSEAAPTGSRLGGRHICQTRHEWDEQYQEAASRTMNTQTHSALSAAPIMGAGGGH